MINLINSKVTNKNGLTEEEFLASYDPSKYDRPSVTVDMLIFTVTDQENKNYRKLPDKELRLLMVKRRPPLHWAMGFARRFRKRKGKSGRGGLKGVEGRDKHR